ncbi:hypothetical protein BC829DRAFT_397922 [Chytridium lagenaria]|nr:hypothetical protein BC829DRAFT_397922 [Chytridium lagenaria]
MSMLARSHLANPVAFAHTRSLLLHNPWDKIIYQGPIAGGVKVLKRVSVISLAMTYSVTPLFAFASSQSSTAAISIMAAALITSSLSTAVVQWCCKPYVASISTSSSETTTSTSSDIKESPLTFETLTFFGQPKRTTVFPGDLQKSTSRVFSTWKTISLNASTTSTQNSPKGNVLTAKTGKPISSKPTMDKAKFDDLVSKSQRKPQQL